MSEPLSLSRPIVDEIHTEMIREHGGSLGLRDEGLLESALARPRHRWAYEDQIDSVALGAAYGYGLAKNHPFVDGNKRTAFMALYTFLSVNDVELDAPEPNAVWVMTGVAGGTISEAELAAWIQEHGRNHEARVRESAERAMDAHEETFKGLAD